MWRTRGNEMKNSKKTPKLTLPQDEFRLKKNDYLEIKPEVETFGAPFGFKKLSIEINDPSIARPTCTLIASKSFMIKGISEGETKGTVSFEHSESYHPNKGLQKIIKTINIIVNKEEK